MLHYAQLVNTFLSDMLHFPLHFGYSTIKSLVVVGSLILPVVTVVALSAPKMIFYIVPCGFASHL